MPVLTFLKPSEARDLLISSVTRGFNKEQADFLENAVLDFYAKKPEQFKRRRKSKGSIRRLANQFFKYAEVNHPLPKEIFKDD